MANEQALASLKDMVETKLTKGELVDLVIGDMRSQTKRELNKVTAEMKELSQSIKLEDILPLIEGTVSVEEPYRSGDQDDSMPKQFRVSVHVKSDVSLSKLPKEVQQVLRRRHELKLMEKELNDRLQKLHEKGEAKSYVLKGLIEQTPEGKQFLQLLEGIKVKVDTRLLLAGKQ